MLWLHKLQQRLAITRREALALLSVLALFLAGLAVQFIQRQNVPPLDRPNLFADSLAAPDTVSGSTTKGEATGTAQSLQAASLLPAERTSSASEKTSSSSDPAPTRSSKTSAIDLNTATSAQLQELRGIGPALADRIISYRDRTPFQSVDQLTEVRGIGPKTLSSIRSRLTVSP